MYGSEHPREAVVDPEGRRVILTLIRLVRVELPKGVRDTDGDLAAGLPRIGRRRLPNFAATPPLRHELIFCQLNFALNWLVREGLC